MILLERKGNVRCMPNEFVSNNKLIKGHRNIANGFNDFFVNIGPSLASKIPVHENVKIHDYLNEQNLHTMFLKPVDENEVLNVVNKCKSKTSGDCDGLSMNLLKRVFSSIVVPFTHICNL